QARNGWARRCWPGATCWQWPARMARPPPPVCWRICWKAWGWRPVSWWAGCRAISGYRRGWVEISLATSSDPLPPFVIEADEYDTAFFDKRSKFVHYRPRIAILNNLEYDHADIFPDIAAIQRQFHHLVRTVPGNGRLVVNAEDPRLAEVLAMGCWTPV